uniref:EF-hand domain-containing protein n=1 Tax=Vannella robusta TaxID=1487602 RepID=A0A7S4HP54_9EUKA|mmetsp:Transcript_13651/g.17188  ORF Transcript_13651/g.17188 Transcript_13651/m.17188 type:complete len:157 (+) Transcript_13651:44-514(+)
MTSNTLDQLSVHDIRAYRQLFDMSGAVDGQLSATQLLEFLNNIGGSFESRDIDNFYSLLSLPNNQPLSFEQFILLSKLSLAPQEPSSKIKQNLKALGVRKESKLSPNQLGNILKETSPNWKQEATDMVAFADRSNKGYCDYSDLECLYKQMVSDTQ